MSPLDKKFLFVVGKGGVGKTTVSAALALAAAKMGKRVLVAQCNAKDRMGHMLSVEPIGPHIRNVAPDLDAVNMEPQAALEEYGLLVLKVRALYKLVFENRFVAAFLRGTPGLEAWAMLGKAQHHALEQTHGRDAYDLVIVDAPATGHGLDLLRVPKVIIQVAPPGLLRREAEQAWNLFSDSTRAGVVLVTLPEEMPTNETLELHATLRDELQLPIAGLVINGRSQTLFTAEDEKLLATLRDTLSSESSLYPLAHCSWVRSDVEALERACEERLAEEIAAPMVSLARLSTLDVRLPEIETLATELKNGFATLSNGTRSPRTR